MLSREEFVRVSLEINLFFQRIMKEHLFFLETNLQPVVPGYITEARGLRLSYDRLLSETVYYSNGVISEEALKSNEIVTPYTLEAEEISSNLTGRSINTRITRAEQGLVSNPNYNCGEWFNIASYINSRSLSLVTETIGFKKRLLSLVNSCRIFISLYPEMLKHLIKEAEYYSEILNSLQKGSLPRKTLCEELNFWNYIMREHAQFIDGMLDPSEAALKETAETAAKKFEKLVEECIKAAESKIKQDSLRATEEIKNYKAAATMGLIKCEIKSIIPPLLADHVLREANHYLRLLRMLNK